MIFTIYTDGASRGNPGKASYGFVVFDEHKKLLYEEGEFLGIKTNNFAEYTAVQKALEYIARIAKGKEASIKFFMDSKLVAEQLSGRYKIKSLNLIPIVRLIKSLEEKIEVISYIHVPRAMNTLADAAANRALDSL